MCSPSILFAYKVGLFNIGAAGQYAFGAGIAIYAALAWQLPWWVCLLLAMAAGAVLGTVSGILKKLLQRKRGHLRHYAQLDNPLRHERSADKREGKLPAPTRCISKA